MRKKEEKINRNNILYNYRNKDNNKDKKEKKNKRNKK
jgi:hypothetical protein